MMHALSIPQNVIFIYDVMNVQSYYFFVYTKYCLEMLLPWQMRQL